MKDDQNISVLYSIPQFYAIVNTLVKQWRLGRVTARHSGGLPFPGIRHHLLGLRFRVRVKIGGALEWWTQILGRMFGFVVECSIIYGLF